MKPSTKKHLLRALDVVEAWIDGKVSISKSVHAKAVTYGDKIIAAIEPKEKK